jgi:anti-anti-sigma factor
MLAVKSSIIDGALVISMNGVLDFSTVDSFEFVNSTPETVNEIIVDFTELEFIDSTGIGAILAILHKANEIKASVEFKSMSEETKELFETIGVFTIKKSLLGEG